MPMDILLIVLMVALLGFMFWSSRRRAKRMKDEQEAKSRAMLPGVKVLLQGGLYGTLVSFDPDDLAKPAHIELAPGTVVEVHSQAILRVVEDDADGAEQEVTEAEYIEAVEDQAEYEADVAEGLIPPASADAPKKSASDDDAAPKA